MTATPIPNEAISEAKAIWAAIDNFSREPSRTEGIKVCPDGSVRCVWNSTPFWMGLLVSPNSLGGFTAKFQLRNRSDGEYRFSEYLVTGSIPNFVAESISLLREQANRG